MWQGHPLDSVEGFPLDIAVKLRRELSVGTAEQLVDVARHGPNAIADMLGLKADQFLDLCQRAASVIPEQTLREIMRPKTTEYPFATGHDAPVDGETFYKGESDDD